MSTGDKLAAQALQFWKSVNCTAHSSPEQQPMFAVSHSSKPAQSEPGKRPGLERLQLHAGAF